MSKQTNQICYCQVKASLLASVVTEPQTVLKAFPKKSLQDLCGSFKKEKSHSLFSLNKTF